MRRLSAPTFVFIVILSQQCMAIKQPVLHSNGVSFFGRVANTLPVADSRETGCNAGNESPPDDEFRRPISLIKCNDSPLWKLRGGGGGEERTLSSPEVLAVGAISAILTLQAILVELHPAESAKVHFSDDSEASTYLVRVLAIIALSWAAMAVLLLFFDCTLNTAFAAMSVLNILDTFRTFFSGEIFSVPLDLGAQVFIMALFPAIAAYAGFTNASWAETFFKVFFSAYILDGAVAVLHPTTSKKLYFSPEADFNDNSLVLLKNIGWWIVAVGVSGMALTVGVDTLPALAYGLLVMVVAGFDLYASAVMNPSRLIPWTIFEALVAAIVLMAGSNVDTPPNEL